ncbi:FtsX-like permease family protein [Streptomyces sp. NPDC002004]
MTGFVLLRARAHRLLLAAALLTVLLTTSVLVTLTAFSGAIGDAALRHSLRTRDTAATTLVVRADVPPERRGAADAAVRAGARRTFDGLPFTVRSLTRSGPYALPRSLQPPAARGGEPDLTRFAALDRRQVEVTAGRAPGARGSVTEVALPEAAARPLALRPGARLTLVDRLGGPRVPIRITGLYRPARPASPYWQLDDLGGRGVRKVAFTTYGPLLTDTSVLAHDGRVSAGTTAWLATADFSTMTTGRIDALRSAARQGPKPLLRDPALAGSTAVSTSLPAVLDRAERSLLVARSTLLIVALQLVLLAGYALLLVARLLSAERAGETRLLRARGGSGGRIAAVAALEALLLALPAMLCAPLLAGPSTRLLAGQGALARIGLRLGDVGGPGVWLVAVGVALGCALAVTIPALGSGRTAGRMRGRLAARLGRPGPGSAGRAAPLPGPVRAGADIGLLVIAVIAYAQLDRQTSGAGAVSGDRSGALGIDPLLVTAPALALLAGTVLTLRLLPLVARLAERRAAGGRGLAAALAGWQFSRRPLRGAGPVLLLVLAVATGMLAIGQSASWDRSQDDQADFAAGTGIRVLGSSTGPLGQAGVYGALPGVRDAAPAVRASMPLSGDHEATVLALDSAHAGLLLRPDLGAGGARKVLGRIRPGTDDTGTVTRLPAGTTRLTLALRIRPAGGASKVSADVSVLVEDRYGTPYRLPLNALRADGRVHRFTLDLARAAAAPAGKPAGPLALTGLDLDLTQPVDRAERHRFTIEGLRATGADGAQRSLRPASGWRVSARTTGTAFGPSDAARPAPPRLAHDRGAAVSVAYGTGFVPLEAARHGAVPTLTVRLAAARTAPSEVRAVATDRFLRTAGARIGQRVDVPLGGSTVRARIVGSVRALPTTGGADERAGTAGSGGPSDAADSGSGADRADTDGDADGGALLMDLPAANRLLAVRTADGVTPTEWWLTPEPGRAQKVAAGLRARPDIDPSQVLVRSEVADALRDDPLGAGPESALAAAAVAAAALAAVGFAVSTAGSLRERSAEFAILRALGTPRRRLARLVAVEQSILVTVGLSVGVALGTLLTRAVVPLVVLTAEATQPVPEVLVELPPARVALLLAGVAAAPLLITAALSLYRTRPAASLREGAS